MGLQMSSLQDTYFQLRVRRREIPLPGPWCINTPVVVQIKLGIVLEIEI